MTNIRLSSGLNKSTQTTEISTDLRQLLRKITAIEENHINNTGEHIPRLLDEMPYLVNCGEIRVNQYISESYAEILAAIIQRKKIAIQAPTGSGKTTLINQLSDDVQAGKLGAELKRIIYAVPRQAIALQQAATMPGGYPVIMAGSGSLEIEEAAAAPVVICTIDKLESIRHLWASSLLSPDEIHLLSEYGFRDKAVKALWEAQNNCPRVVALSANVPEALENFGYTIQHITRERNPERITTIKLYHEGSAAGIVRDHLPRHKGTTVVLFNDINMLESFAADIERAGKRAAIISSKARKYKEESDIYKQLTESGTLPDGLDYLLCTSVLEVGVNIVSSVTEFIVCNERDHIAVSQLLARARMTTGINESISVTIYQAFKDAATASKQKDLILKKWMPNQPRTMADAMAKAELLAMDLCRRLNDAQAESLEDCAEWLPKYGEDPIYKTVHYDDAASGWLPFAPALMWYAQLDYQDRPFFLFIADLLKTVPGMSIDRVELVRLDDSGKDESVKDKCHIEKERAFELMAAEPLQYLDAVYHTTSEQDLKKSIREHHGPPPRITPDLQEFILDNSDVFTGTSATLPARRTLKLYAAARKLSTFKGVSIAKAAQVVNEIQGRGEFAEMINRLIALYDASKHAGSMGNVRNKDAKRIKEAIRKADLMNTETSTADLAERVRRITGDKDARRNVMRAKEIFNYTQHRDRITLTGYVQAADLLPLFLSIRDQSAQAQSIDIQENKQGLNAGMKSFKEHPHKETPTAPMFLTKTTNNESSLQDQRKVRTNQRR